MTIIPARLNCSAPGRRRFLKGAGAALAVLPLGAAWARTPAGRSLSFVHTHTGERLSTVYFQDGQYRVGELERINQLLRDFRTGDVHSIDTGVLDILADLRVLADHDEPYEVISGYRSPQTNAALRRHSSAWPSTACISRAAPSICGCRDSRPASCASSRSRWAAAASDSIHSPISCTSTTAAYAAGSARRRRGPQEITRLHGRPMARSAREA